MPSNNPDVISARPVCLWFGRAAKGFFLVRFDEHSILGHGGMLILVSYHFRMVTLSVPM